MALPPPISGKHLAQHFNKYIEYRQYGRKGGSSFTEQLRMISTNRPQQPVSKTFTLGQAKSHPSRFARSKNITMVQANRLAHYAPLIQEAALKYQVPVELICGVILQESGGNSRAESRAGAKGLMQLMPQTAERFGVKDVFDPRQNIDGGTRYLRWLTDRFNGDIKLALAGYNAGEGNVEKYGNRVPPFRETKEYIPNVLGYTQTMVDIFLAQRSETLSSTLPTNARRA